MNHTRASRHLGVTRGVFEVSPRKVHPTHQRTITTQQPMNRSRVDASKPSDSNEMVSEVVSTRHHRHNRGNREKVKDTRATETSEKVMRPSWKTLKPTQSNLVIHSLGSLSDTNTTYSSFLRKYYSDIQDGFFLRVIEEMCPASCSIFSSSSGRHSKYEILDFHSNLILRGNVDCSCCASCSQTLPFDSDDEDSTGYPSEMQVLSNYPDAYTEASMNMMSGHHAYAKEANETIDAGYQHQTLILYNQKHDRCVMRLLFPTSTSIYTCSGENYTRIESPPGILVGWVSRKSVFLNYPQYLIYDASDVNNINTLLIKNRPGRHLRREIMPQEIVNQTVVPTTPSRPIDEEEIEAHSPHASRLQNQDSIMEESESELGDILDSDVCNCLCPFFNSRNKSSLIYEVTTTNSHQIFLNSLNNSQRLAHHMSQEKFANSDDPFKLLTSESLNSALDGQLNREMGRSESDSTDNSSRNITGRGKTAPSENDSGVDLDRLTTNQQAEEQSSSSPMQPGYTNTLMGPVPSREARDVISNNSLHVNDHFDYLATLSGSSHEITNEKMITCAFSKGVTHKQKMLILASLLVVNKNKDLT